MGDDGDDLISLQSSYKNTIAGGKGNDTINFDLSNTNVLIQYNLGDGNDLITGFNETSTLKLGDDCNSTYSRTENGDDVVITVKDGEQITLKGAAQLSKLNIGGVAKLNVNNSKNAVEIIGGRLDDSVVNDGKLVTIITNAGNDTISNSGSFVTISGGTGNDFIELQNNPQRVFIEYRAGDGNDFITGFRADSTLSVAKSAYSTAKSGSDVIVTVGEGKITLKGAASLSKLNIIREQSGLVTLNTDEEISIVGTDLEDSIINKGDYVTVDAQGGNDSIVNEYGFYSSIAVGAGNDVINVSSGAQITVNAGAGNDQISLEGSDETFIEYKAVDGSDIIRGFDETTTLNIAKSGFTSATSGNDIILSVGTNKITLEGAATLSNVNISNGTYATFTIKNNGVICASDLPDSLINSSYKFNDKSFSLMIDELLKNYLVTIKNEDDAVKADWKSGAATLKSGSVLEYQFIDDENGATLTSKTYGDEISFSEDTNFNYGKITADVQSGGKLSTRSGKALSFYDNTSARVTAPKGYQVDVAASNITINDLPINAQGGAGTVTVEENGMSFEGYGAQFADLEVAKESYFGKLAPTTVNYNSADKSYTIKNSAQVNTLTAKSMTWRFPLPKKKVWTLSK